MSKNFHSLTVKEIRPETPLAYSVVFEVPEELQSVFQYKQGQYLTLKFTINGKEERRAYSMSSSPLEAELKVTIKRVKGGKVSNHIADQVKAGDSVEVMPPEGRFFTKLDQDNRKTYYLIGAGSGITPLMSILKTILETEAQSSVFLLYGNRSEETIIFKDELIALQKKYAGQLHVDHVLSQPKMVKASGIAGMFGKRNILWSGKTGRITSVIIRDFLNEHPGTYKKAEFFICGPDTLITNTEKTLKLMEIDDKIIHAEHFTSASDIAPAEGASDGTNKKVRVKLDGTTHEISVPDNQSILDAMLELGMDPPYSCKSAACSTCMAKVVSGKVNMKACFALDDDEVKNGFILICQSHPEGEGVEIDMDV